MTEDQFRNGGVPEDDVLDVVPPELIPGVLFEAVWKTLQAQYKGLVPGTGQRKAQLAAVATLEVITAFYHKAAEAEEADG